MSVSKEAKAQTEAGVDTPAPAAPAPAAPVKLELVVTPIADKHFQLAKAAYQQHNAFVPAGTTKEQLLDQRLWDNVSNKIKLYDEIRVIPMDGSFVARMIVTLRHAGTVRVHLLSFNTLEVVDYSRVSGADKFQVTHKGALGWCVVDTGTGANVFTHQSSQSAAYKRMEDHVKLIGR